MKLIEVSRKELKTFEIAISDTNESNREEASLGGTRDGKLSWDSMDIVSTVELSSPLLIHTKRSLAVIKESNKQSPMNLRFPLSPEDSPLLKRHRKIKSRSVERVTANLRYEKFKQNLQQMIKKLKKDKKDQISSPSGSVIVFTNL